MGNKVDLADERNNGGVSYEMAMSLANEWNVNYFETSAITDPVNL